jgi:hypothetical protein
MKKTIKNKPTCKKHLNTKRYIDTRITYDGIFDKRERMEITKCVDCGAVVRKRVLRVTKSPSEWGKKLLGSFSRIYKTDKKTGERLHTYTYKHVPMRPIDQ